MAKLAPLGVFVLLTALAFRADVFTLDFWGRGNAALGGTLEQVRGVMLVTVWVFVGVEGASVYSARAERRADVGLATLLGFAFTLALLVAISVLSLGVMTQPELAALKNPSTAYVLERVAGRWGAALISAGLLVSLAGSLLSWLMLASETLYMAARDGTAPRWLAHENAHGTPAHALWLTSACAQIFLVITLLSDSTYLALVQLGTAMVLLPYAWAALYGLRLAWRGEGYGLAESGARRRDFAIALAAVMYAAWLVYAGGLKYLLLSSLLYTPGALLYAWARREHGRALFSRKEWALAAALLAADAAALAGLHEGWLAI